MGKPDVIEALIHRTKPVLGTLAKSVDTFVKVHHQGNSSLVAALVPGKHVDKIFLLHIGVEKYRLDVHHMNFVIFSSAAIASIMRIPYNLQAGAKVPPSLIPGT